MKVTSEVVSSILECVLKMCSVHNQERWYARRKSKERYCRFAYGHPRVGVAHVNEALSDFAYVTASLSAVNSLVKCESAASTSIDLGEIICFDSGALNDRMTLCLLGG